MKKPRLTRLQKELLGHLCLDAWNKPPRHVRASTVLSLEERGLIKVRAPNTYLWRWCECPCQLTDKGHQVFTDLVHWEMAHRS